QPPSYEQADHWAEPGSYQTRHHLAIHQENEQRTNGDRLPSRPLIPVGLASERVQEQGRGREQGPPGQQAFSIETLVDIVRSYSEDRNAQCHECGSPSPEGGLPALTKVHGFVGHVLSHLIPISRGTSATSSESPGR